MPLNLNMGGGSGGSSSGGSDIAVTRSNIVTQERILGIDAVELNPNIVGTIAYQLNLLFPQIIVTALPELDVSQTVITAISGNNVYTGTFVGSVCRIAVLELGTYTLTSNEYFLSMLSVDMSVAMQRCVVSLHDNGIALIPAMTSNTAPSGTVYASSSNTNKPAWCAFDGSRETAWYSVNQVDNAILRYTFSNVVSISNIVIHIVNDNGLVKSCRPQYSTNGTTFNDFNVGVVNLVEGENRININTVNSVKAVQLVNFTTTNPYSTVIINGVQCYRFE